MIAGLYARLTFPDLTMNGTALKMDGILSAYVISEFPVFVGLVVVMGLISAGLSTLEGLIQSLSTTVTADIIEPLFGKSLLNNSKNSDKLKITINKIVIALLGIAAILISYDQLINPKLSVAIFAQNGVYAYFAAAFVPILFGMFIKDVPKIVPISASVSAVVVHFSMYYGKLGVPFTQANGENPGVAACIAILISLLVGFISLKISKRSING